MNIFNILFELIQRLSSVCEVILTWLNTEYSILGFSFKPLFITGAVVVAFLVARIIKEFVPLS